MSESTESPENEPNPIVRGLQTITPGIIRRSFAIKFGLVLLIMALSIGAIGLAATQVLVDQTEANAEAEFQGVASQQADVIEQWLESNAQQVRLLSANPVWASDEASELEITLENEQQGLAGEVHEMHIVDVEVGPIVESSTSIDSGTTFASGDRQWVRGEFSAIQELGLDDIYVSDTYEQDDERVVAFVSPTAGVDERFLMVEVSVFEIQQSLRGALEQDVGFSQVVNTGTYQGDSETTNNVMIDARGEAGKLLETYATSDGALEPLRLANELRDETDAAGVIARMDANDAVLDEEYTAGYAPIEVQQEDSQASITTKDWVVVTHGPRSDVFGLVDALSQWGLIVTGAAVLLIGITGSILGYSTSTSIDRLTRKTDEMREGNLDVNLYTSRVDNIGRLYDGFADMRDALQQQIEEAEESRQEAESARKEAEVARAEAEELANYLQEKTEEYSEIMQQVSAGDLTQRMTQDGEEESMDRIAAEFNEMIGELEKTTGQLKGYVDEVEEAGSEVEQSAGTVRKASEQVADSVQRISDDAYDQKERLREISATIDQITQDIEAIAEEHEGTDTEDSLAEIETIATEIHEIVDLSQETMAEAENVAGAAEEQAAELNEVSERANDLQRYAAPLRDILGRFETEAEHEFVFSVGPTGGAASPGSTTDQKE
jgi:methyl-accepting chemotaxis protein